MKNTWGIVIAVAAFLIQFIIFGICFSFGIYVIELQNEFETGLSIISSIGSIHFGFLLCTGPFASFLMRKISYRRVCLLGAIMSSVGLYVLPFTPNIPYLIVFFGALTGTGYSFLYIPSYTLSGLWFENNRGIVTGIVSSGSSLGGIVFPYLIEFLIGKFGWRGSFFILASLNLQTVVFSCLMRESPMQKAWVKSRTKYVNNNLTNSTESIYTIHDDDGSSVQLLLGPDYYTKVGVDLRQAASLLSIQQGTMVVGCVVGGILGNLRSFNRKGLFLFSNFFSGFCVLTYTFPVLHTMAGLAIINSVFGLGTGIGLGLIVILVSDFVGSQLIGDGMGYLMLASGIGNFIGPPLGGYLIEKTGSYDAAFFLCGTASLFSGVILLIIPIRDCFQNSKKYAISPVT